MDPNNNQPININPLGQPIAPQSNVTPPPPPIFPVQETAQTPVPAPIFTPMPDAPRSGSKKGIILIVILLILALGMAIYVFFVKNQLDAAKKAAIENTSVVIPTPTIILTPTPAAVDQVDVASPEADLKSIEDDVQGL